MVAQINYKEPKILYNGLFFSMLEWQQDLWSEDLG